MKSIHSTLPGIISAALLTLACTAERADAATITHTYSSIATGTLDGMAFTTSITITGTYDTSTIQTDGGALRSVDFSTCTVQLDGVGTYDFTTTLRTFVNGGVVGLSRGSLTGTDLIDFNFQEELLTWNMATPIGPIIDDVYPSQWTYIPVETTGGVLVLDSLSGPTTFTATAVPEASAVTLAFAACGTLALRRRRI